MFLERLVVFAVRNGLLSACGVVEPQLTQFLMMGGVAVQEASIAIVTNSQDLAASEGAQGGYRIIAMADGFKKLAQQCSQADLVIVDDDPGRLFQVCLLRPFLGFKLISVDLILRPPVGVAGYVSAFIKRLLLSMVDKFILYFRNTKGFERFYGIRSERTVYVPFKVNGLGTECWPRTVPAGDYVLCAGRTLRDLRTFVSAITVAGHSGVLLQQEADVMSQHGTDAWKDNLPANVQLLLHDGRFETFLSVIANARLVVIPRFKEDICSTGISTYLVAMALGKCVIISRGPGADDILRDEAELVAPQDVGALTKAIDRLWSDDEERLAIASRAKHYAEALGGSERLCRDVLTESVRCMPEARRPQLAGSF